MREQHNYSKVVILLPPDNTKLTYIDEREKDRGITCRTPCS